MKEKPKAQRFDLLASIRSYRHARLQ